MQILRLLAMLVFLSFHFIMNAQWNVGFLTGFQQSKTNLLFEADSPTFVSNRQNLLRPTIFIPLEYQLKEWFSLKTGFRYTEEGAIYVVEDDLPFDFESVTNRIRYFSFPLLMEFHLNYNQKNGLYGQIGPYLAYAGSISQEIYMLDDSQYINLTQSRMINRLDYGILAGLGLERQISERLKVQIQYTYQIGLKNIYQNSNNELFTESSGGSLGIVLDLKKQEKHLQDPR